MEFEELLDSRRVEYANHGEHHHTRSGWIQLKHCPGCGSDNFHLGFNLARRYFVCWKCGGKKTVKTLYDIGLQAQDVKEFFSGVEIYQHTEKPQGKLVEPKRRDALGKAHKEYLRFRKYDPKEIESLWEIEGIGLDSRLPWRLYIPVVQQGKRVSWTTRAIGDVSQRYISASEAEEAIPHKHCLYGIDYVGLSVVVVEGPTDVWRVGPGAVGLFGTAFTTAQVKLLGRFPYRYLLFDNSSIAQRQAQNLALSLSCFPGKTMRMVCDAKDPGEMSPQDVKTLRKHAGLD